MTGTGKATIETLQRLVDAFNAHELDAVMSFFADHPVLELPIPLTTSEPRTGSG